MLTTLKSVDFPAFGSPTNPASAKSFNSKINLFVSPGRPFSAIFGTRFLSDLKAAFPLPPLPPLATTTVCPSVDKSAIKE